MGKIPEWLMYKCQFCGYEGPHKDWLEDGYKCPKCNRLYDCLLAQESAHTVLNRGNSMIVLDYLKKTTEVIRQSSRNNWTYRSFEEFVLQNGKVFTPSLVKVKQGKKKECFKNAYYLADGNANYTYVEGYASVSTLPIPFLHAWCIDKEGKVIDPTWEDGEEYIGVPFNLAYVRMIILKRRKFGVIDNVEMAFPLLSGSHKDFLQEKV